MITAEEIRKMQKEVNNELKEEFLNKFKNDVDGIKSDFIDLLTTKKYIKFLKAISPSQTSLTKYVAVHDNYITIDDAVNIIKNKIGDYFTQYGYDVNTTIITSEEHKFCTQIKISIDWGKHKNNENENNE